MVMEILKHDRQPKVSAWVYNSQYMVVETYWKKKNDEFVFNATFNNISVISLRSVLLVEETGVSGGNHRPATSNWQT